MAALLRERAALVDPIALPLIVNDRRAEIIRRNLDGPLTPAESMSRRFDYAIELLNAGRIDDALAATLDLERRAQALHPEGYRKAASRLLVVRAVAHIRQGEQQNCNDRHSRQSCLLPIRGSGVYQRREGPQAAIQVLNGVLADDPANLRARWLLNVAHMTLGQYPAGVPAAALIPPAAFASAARAAALPERRRRRRPRRARPVRRRDPRRLRPRRPPRPDAVRHRLRGSDEALPPEGRRPLRRHARPRPGSPASRAG